LIGCGCARSLARGAPASSGFPRDKNTGSDADDGRHLAFHFVKERDGQPVSAAKLLNGEAVGVIERGRFEAGHVVFSNE
jgi:hypothetical protein